jgi:SAM-dependent methyltransferase
MSSPTPTPTPVADLAAVKARQQAAWSTDNYALIGNTLQIVGENLCEALDLRSGMRVLDVAAGNGNATLAAARRWCEVTSTDYVPALLDSARRRAEANGFVIDFRQANAENLPFADAAFGVVLSTFGMRFTPDQDRAASEMARVCRPGGRIGMANGTPDSFIGQLFRTIGKYITPPAGVKSAALWGTRSRLEEMFGAAAAGIRIAEQAFVFRYRSPQHWLEMFRTYYGPINKALAALDENGQQAFAQDLLDLMGRLNRSGDDTLVLPSPYLEVVVERKA